MQKWPLQYRKSPAWRRSCGDELTARFRMRTKHPLKIQSGPRDAFIHESYRQWFQGGQEPGSNANLIEGLRAIGQLPDRVSFYNMRHPPKRRALSRAAEITLPLA